MAYLDSAGNVNYSDPTQGQVGAQWQAFHRQQTALQSGPGKVQPAVPASVLPAGAEKAARGHD